MTIPIEWMAAVGAALTGAIGILFRMVITNYVDQIKELRTELATWKSVANANLFTAETAARRYVTERGQTPLLTLAPVVAESNSPPTEKQSITADLATVRARTVAARLALELPAMEIAEHVAKPESFVRKILPPYTDH